MIHNSRVNHTGDVIEHRKLGHGRWIVVATTMSGGGTGMGPYDIYPDGHTLILRRLDANGNPDFKSREKRFFQTGAFTDEEMLPYITPVKKD
jgi:hypothetical protein